MRIVFITPDLSNNSIGRTFCLWQLTEALGWQSEVASTVGDQIWKPLAGSRFASACKRLSSAELNAAFASAPPDLIIAVKPLPSSFGCALTLSKEYGTPVLLDIDDPDLEAQLSWKRPLKRMAKGILRPKTISEFKRLRGMALIVPTMVSNPELQRTYGGELIPHVRADPGFGSPHVDSSPTVAFVGTNHKHKGLKYLRRAVAQSRNYNMKLVVTDVKPRDSKPWEEWVGHTSFAQGLGIVARSDIIIVPSLDTTYSRGQFPAKVVDAMLSGRGVAVSNIGPLPWSVGDGGLVTKPASVNQLKKALAVLAEPSARAELGARARARALELFTVEANAEKFARAVLGAIAKK
jgi:hypothetical protein